MKPDHAKSSTYIDSSKEIDNKDPKFKIGGIVRIAKCKNIFAKVYTPNWSKENVVMKNVKTSLSWPYVSNDLNREEIVETFCKKKLQNNKPKRI